MIGRRACLLADRDHRSTDRETHDIFEGHHAAVDDRQAGGDAASLEMFAVVAAETAPASKSKDEAAAADRKIASLGLKSAFNVIAVILQNCFSRSVHVRLSTTGAANGFRRL